MGAREFSAFEEEREAEHLTLDPSPHPMRRGSGVVKLTSF
jgi:hypothetical protein